jgi:hypothetical protein
MCLWFAQTLLWSITRGITIVNQNAVLNSNLIYKSQENLWKVSLRASIQDSNIPLQDKGSQKN